MSDAPKQSPLASPEPWSLVADDYSAELLPMFELFSNDALELAGDAARQRVLDVAAGPGTLCLLAARAGADVSSIDFSPVMLENLKRRFSAAGLQVDARVGDGQALPWEADQFDAAFSMFGLMFFPDRAQGFRELLRVLKPGGVAVVSSWAPFEGLFKSIMSSLQEVLPDIPFGTGKGPLGDAGDLEAELSQAGFGEVRELSKTHVLKVPSVRHFWESCERTSAPVVLLKRRLGDAKWAEVTQGVVDRLQALHGDGQVEMKTTAFLGSGRKG
jgi:ubiquinone/menaquinone biosynthesis C-methylase UbiE